MNYSGIIIEESLGEKDVLGTLKIVNTEVSLVTEKDKTSWLKRWTLHTVEIPESEIENVAKKISESIDSEHAGSWFADFMNATTHYIVFSHKVFKVDRSEKRNYDEAARYATSIGIPDYQLGFLK